MLTLASCIFTLLLLLLNISISCLCWWVHFLMQVNLSQLVFLDDNFCPLKTIKILESHHFFLNAIFSLNYLA